MNLRGTAAGLLAASATLAMVGQDVALAQAPNPNVAVANRPRPDFDPLGIRAGSFLIFPELGTGLEYDTNIFATNTDTTSDFIATVAPVVEFQSNFSRHALDVTLGADLGFYFDNSDVNYQDVYIEGSGAYDVTRDDGFGVDFLFGQFHDNFEDPNNIGLQENQPYVDLGGSIDYTQVFNRFNFTPFFSGRRQDYEQSVNEGRNTTRYNTGLRAGYFLSPRVNLYTLGQYFIINRDTESANGASRDSDGFTVGVGTQLDFTGLLFGNFFVGYEQESFDDPALDDEPGFAFDAGLTWNITTLTTLQLNGASSIETATDPGASSDFRSVIDLRADHELLRNVIIGAGFGYQRDDFRGTDQTDNTFRAGVDGAYLLNRNFRIEASYLFSTRSSDDETSEFDRNRVFLTLVGML